jgi:hypothetical protein
MAKSKHNTTRRGTQKQRARKHEQHLEEAHPVLWRQRCRAEYAAAKLAAEREQLDA